MNTPQLDSSFELATQNRFGALAVKKGLLTAAQLQEAVRVQKSAAKVGLRKRLGEILIRKGYLTPAQVKNIISHQKIDSEKNRIGNYELLAKLGQGGMGVVFKARQISLNRVVALKVLAAELAKNEEYRKRFLHEARAVARLDHRNIVNAIDVGYANDVFYFAMEYVEGESLGQLLIDRGGRFPEDEALDYVEQIAYALQHAHEHGLLHRDVKPDNLLIKKDGTAKLADLGLARPRHKNVSAAGEEGMVVGTPYYISPEQARGKSKLSPASDLYSLGASLFHLLTGRPPFMAGNSASILALHCTEPAPDPRDFQPHLSPATTQICLKLLQKDPSDRYRDGKELIDDIRKAREKIVPAPIAVEDATTRIKARGKKGSKIHTRSRSGRTTAVGRKRGRIFSRRTGRGQVAPTLSILLFLSVIAAAMYYFFHHG